MNCEILLIKISSMDIDGYNMTPINYIVASCKPWHETIFESLQATSTGEWRLVKTPEELEDAVSRFPPRYIFFMHWSWRVPQSIFSQFECVCFHMTDLPYGRGGSPLQNLILAGHAETQLSAIRMVEEMDAGPVYTKRPMSLDGRAEEIYKRAGEIGLEIIRWMIESEPMPNSQIGKPVQFKRRKPEQSILPVQGELTSLYDHIRMLDAPTYPNAFIKYGDYRIEFTEAELLDDELCAKVVILKESK